MPVGAIYDWVLRYNGESLPPDTAVVLVIKASMTSLLPGCPSIVLQWSQWVGSAGSVSRSLTGAHTQSGLLISYAQDPLWNYMGLQPYIELLLSEYNIINVQGHLCLIGYPSHSQPPLSICCLGEQVRRKKVPQPFQCTSVPQVYIRNYNNDLGSVGTVQGDVGLQSWGPAQTLGQLML